MRKLATDETHEIPAGSQLDQKEFLRRASYLRGHLEAVVRMVRDGQDATEILRQMRAVRRAAEKLEVQCLLSHLSAGDDDFQSGNLRKVVELYRLANR